MFFVVNVYFDLSLVLYIALLLVFKFYRAYVSALLS